VGSPPQAATRTATGSQEARLEWCRARLFVGVGKKGGELTGKNPTDRGRLGSKHHVITDRQGLPLCPPKITGANVHDGTTLCVMLERVRAVAGRVDRPQRRPKTLYADKGYHSESNRLHLRMKGIRCRIARPKIESRERLGRKRWVVERTIAWFHRFRRLLVRYERRADIHQAFLTLASCIILLRALNS
jgi:transposase